jgi:hypothetical protein
MTPGPWIALSAELDLWAEAGRPVRLWLRDDDAIAPGPALDRLASLSERFSLPVLLAVIPMLAQPALAATLRAMPCLLPCQHGTWHRNHAGPGEKKSEFGGGRAQAEVRTEIATARRRLEDLLGPALLPVFVPPWNRIDPAIAVQLPELGFSGLSCFRGFDLGEAGRPNVINSEIDVMNWKGGRVGYRADALAAEICDRLSRFRQRSPSDPAILGLLLHHRDHDGAGWAALETVLARLTTHPAVVPIDPRRLFSQPLAA